VRPWPETSWAPNCGFSVALYMSNEELDQLRIAYKNAVDKWVDSIRAEEALATPDHSETAMERWDEARFREQDAQTKAAEARDAYKDRIRRVNYGF
jgi:hypothetical protein